MKTDETPQYTYRAIRRPLIEITVRGRYCTIDLDLDTIRDGYFTFPEEGRTEIMRLIDRWDKHIKGTASLGVTYLSIYKVLREVAEELAWEIARIAEKYRNHFEDGYRVVEGERAPLVGYRKKGRSLPGIHKVSK